MDSWLFDNVDDRPDDSESDPEETKAEVEARLYSIVHHNDLSKPLPPELAKHYSISCTENGELEVILKDSLEQLKSEECEKVNKVLTSSESKTEDVIQIEDDENVAIISEDNNIPETKTPFKRFRYSDINLDLEKRGEYVFPTPDDDLRLNEAVLNHNYRQYFHLNIPSFDFPDWKTSANSSFISFGAERRPTDRNMVIEKMTQALSRANPGEKVKSLRHFASLLHKRQTKILRKKRQRQNKNKQTRLQSSPSIDLTNETQNNNTPVHNIKDEDTSVNKKKKTKRKEKINGSISLNSTPFRPDNLTVDLTSEEKKPTFLNAKDSRSEMNRSKSTVPDKWSPSMIRFYTQKSKNNIMETNIENVLDNLKRTSIKSDWWMDERDQAGLYQRSPVKWQRCNNCRQFGHFQVNCPEPRRRTICILCGDSTHSVFACHKKVCMKCGVFILNNEFFGEECSACYYATFNTVAACEVCGKMTHHSTICPDLWRSFHATTGGEKKIPPYVMQNKRKYCCSCGGKGHFSHECSTPTNSFQRISPFVTNYSVVPSQKGTSEVIVPKNCSFIVENPETDMFLQTLSNKVNAEIMCEADPAGYVFKIQGTFKQCQRVKNEIEDYVNVKKRKRLEPPLPIIKKQRTH